MPSKPRPLSNNVCACIEDMLATVSDIWPTCAAASARAEDRYQDPILLAQLGRITRGLAVIEHHLRNARQGRYQERSSH